MHRHQILRTSSLAAAVLSARSANAAPAPAGETKSRTQGPAIITKALELSLASPWKSSRGGYALQAQMFARRLEQALGGRLKIFLKTRAQSAIETLCDGESDLYFGSEQTNVALHPAFGFFAGLPGEKAAGPLQFEHWLRRGGGQELWDELSAKFGIKSMMAGHTGPAPGLWSTRKLRSLRDIAGEKIFVQGLAREVALRIGARPADIKADAALEALSRRDVIAVEWGNSEQSVSAGLPSVARYCTPGALNSQGSMLSLSMKREVWERLSTDLQSTLAAAAEAETRRAAADWIANDQAMRQTMAEALQIEYVPPPDDMRQAVNQNSETVTQETGAYDALAGRIYASYWRAVRLPKSERLAPPGI